MVLTDNLVAYWKLDEVSGNRLDSTGRGNTLVESGATINSRSGKVASGADLVRANASCLRLNHNADISMGDIDFTIALWCRYDDLAVISQTFVSKENGVNWDYIIYTSGSKITVYMNGPGGGGYLPWGGSAVLQDTWYFVVVIHDSVNDLLKISVDNESFVTTSFSGGPGVTASANLSIGAQSSLATDTLLDGIVDEVGLWKRVLTPAECTQLYNDGAGLTYPFVTAAIIFRKRTGTRFRLSPSFSC